MRVGAAIAIPGAVALFGVAVAECVAGACRDEDDLWYDDYEQQIPLSDGFVRFTMTSVATGVAVWLFSTVCR